MDEQDLAVEGTAEEGRGRSFKIVHTVSQECFEKKHLHIGGTLLSCHYHGNNPSVNREQVCNL